MHLEKKLRVKKETISTNVETVAAFNPKALNNNTMAGLLTFSPFPAPSHPPEADSGIRIAGGQNWRLQQRDCPGFTPDSLFRHTHCKWDAHR
jgi:hypothetical protein